MGPRRNANFHLHHTAKQENQSQTPTAVPKEVWAIKLSPLSTFSFQNILQYFHDCKEMSVKPIFHGSTFHLDLAFDG